jgi:hypothetical protein
MSTRLHVVVAGSRRGTRPPIHVCSPRWSSQRVTSRRCAMRHPRLSRGPYSTGPACTPWMLPKPGSTGSGSTCCGAGTDAGSSKSGYTSPSDRRYRTTLREIDGTSASLDPGHADDTRPHTGPPATQTEFASAELACRCACCGQECPEDRLVRLHSHNEVAVCFPCLDWLNPSAVAEEAGIAPCGAPRVGSRPARASRRSRLTVPADICHRSGNRYAPRAAYPAVGDSCRQAEWSAKPWARVATEFGWPRPRVSPPVGGGGRR